MSKVARLRAHARDRYCSVEEICKQSLADGEQPCGKLTCPAAGRLDSPVGKLQQRAGMPRDDA